MAPGFVEPDLSPFSHGELHLVSITNSIIRTVDCGNDGFCPSNSGEGVLYLLPLEPQLLLITHVAKPTAAAAKIIGAVGGQPCRRRVCYVNYMSPCCGLSHFVQRDEAGLSRQSTPDEAGHPVGQLPHALPLGAVPLHGERHPLSAAEFPHHCILLFFLHGITGLRHRQ